MKRKRNRKIRIQLHDPNSPLLLGTLGPDDVIKECEVKSYKEWQMSLFD